MRSQEMPSGTASAFSQSASAVRNAFICETRSTTYTIHQKRRSVCAFGVVHYCSTTSHSSGDSLECTPVRTRATPCRPTPYMLAYIETPLVCAQLVPPYAKRLCTTRCSLCRISSIWMSFGIRALDARTRARGCQRSRSLRRRAEQSRAHAAE